MDVSIVIVNWNTRDILRDCLASTYANTKNITFEVIVVDNASRDDSVSMLKENFPQVILIENSENRGFAAANNQGMAIARGKYVLLLNSDTVILENDVRKTVLFADGHPEAAVIGCMVLNPDRTLQPTCFMFPSLLNMFLASTYLYKIFSRNKFLGRERMTWWDRSDTMEVDVVTGCFMLVRQSAIQQVGMMDEQFFMYGEETDWCYRFKQAGWKVIFAPIAQIIHLGGASSALVKPEMRLQLSGSVLLFIKKHKNWVQYMLASIFTSLFFFMRIPYWSGVAVISKENRDIALRTLHVYLQGFFMSLTGYRHLCIKRTPRCDGVLTNERIRYCQ